jgi:nucleoid-associated protein EbfC
MNPKQLQEMMSRAQEMQRQVQQKMRETVVEASSGGGAVTVKMNGSKQVVKVIISPDTIQGGDVEMLQDMIAAAVNEAGRKVDEAMQSQLGGMLGGMGLPSGLF